MEAAGPHVSAGGGFNLRRAGAGGTLTLDPSPIRWERVFFSVRLPQGSSFLAPWAGMISSFQDLGVETAGPRVLTRCGGFNLRRPGAGGSPRLDPSPIRWERGVFLVRFQVPFKKKFRCFSLISI